MILLLNYKYPQIQTLFFGIGLWNSSDLSLAFLKCCLSAIKILYQFQNKGFFFSLCLRVLVAYELFRVETKSRFKIVSKMAESLLAE